MTEHVLKTVEPYFSADAAGEKTFEVRRNDRAFQRGDTLILIDVEGCECGDLTTCPPQRPALRRVVTFVYAGDPNLRDLGGIAPGHVVLGLGVDDGELAERVKRYLESDWSTVIDELDRQVIAAGLAAELER